MNPRLLLGLFALANLLGAGLIFWVEPLLTKMTLPPLGGSPAVWITALMFFQLWMLLGYLYAHLLIRYAQPSLQLALHAAAITGALLALPVLPGDGWRPLGDADPRGAILTMLAANVALPFLVLEDLGRGRGSPRRVVACPVELAFATRLREEMKFDSVDELKVQIARDVEAAREWLAQG